MSELDYTQQQSNEEQRRAQDLSLKPNAPPAEVPGYAIEQFLGSGAYGEVWVGVDHNTGRRVAIKFFTHRGGVDWSLLSREVEKLVFLSADRYVVQLLDVGWDADPPYYVMDYIENGSLDDLLKQQGPRPLVEAVELFREVAVGLMHLHGKGVLHCDLKPANVLLDEDHKPRLADFGQSRLSHEQSPALGTMFFMAPEQADLEAVPDARWDVYALGALLYCMLTGLPPYRTESVINQFDTAGDLSDRLEKYRKAIMTSKPPAAHRKVPGIDRYLIDIIDRCLARGPKDRFPSVQSVLEALRSRDESRVQRPLQMLGLFGPLVLLAIMAMFFFVGFQRAVATSEGAVMQRTQRSNEFAATSAARGVAGQINQYFKAVESVADDPDLQRELESLTEYGSAAELLEELQDPNLAASDPAVENARRELMDHDQRQRLQANVEELLYDPHRPTAASWFITDAHGTHVASAFKEGERLAADFGGLMQVAVVALDQPPAVPTVGKNYGWRTYFHGGDDDLKEMVEVGGRVVTRYGFPEGHISSPHLSAVFESTATHTWKVAISAPIVRDGKFLGIIALTVEVGEFIKGEQFEESGDQFAVLVDGREGPNYGVVLQHPLFDEILKREDKLPREFSVDPKYRMPLEKLREERGNVNTYDDPLTEDDKLWIAAEAPVILTSNVRGGSNEDTGLAVVVQQSRESSIGPIQGLRSELFYLGVTAGLVLVAVAALLWFWVNRRLKLARVSSERLITERTTSTAVHDMETLAAPRRTSG